MKSMDIAPNFTKFELRIVWRTEIWEALSFIKFIVLWGRRPYIGHMSPVSNECGGLAPGLTIVMSLTLRFHQPANSIVIIQR